LIKQKKIVNIFNKLNDNQIDFLILRKDERIFENSNDDIDILVNINFKKKIGKILASQGLRYYKDSEYLYEYLYQSKPHEHYFCKNLGINLDICFDISYKSFNNSEIIPVDDETLDYIFQNKKKVTAQNFYYFKLDDHSQLLHLICHCIFNKKFFSEYYKQKIEKLILQIDHIFFVKILEKIFFKFSPFLLKLILQKKYNNIIDNYLSFREY